MRRALPGAALPLDILGTGVALPGLGPPAERIVRTLADGGNQVAASIPAALHRALADGRPARGDAFLLPGTGAGPSLGGAVMRRRSAGRASRSSRSSSAAAVTSSAPCTARAAGARSTSRPSPR